MNLEKLYKMQEGLDKHILENAKKRNVVMTDEELLEKTILALLVEVGELANATRCFKHWSIKGPESDERILDELADVIHFYLSVGNQLRINCGLDSDIFEGEQRNSISRIFLKIYSWTSKLGDNIKVNYLLIADTNTKYQYNELGAWIKNLYIKLGFTDEEVEQAYLKKHEENYKRQREGY